MKRFLLGLGAVVIGLFGVAALAPRTYADVNNFTIRSFDADYYINKDAEGHSTLKTVEKIVAVFPNYDQNHGLERAIPKEYDGHSTQLQIASVTDSNGNKRAYSESTSNDNLVLRMGDEDTYVQGVQEYIITYTQRDVTKFFQDTNDDEFYWDVNGIQWSQAMGEVSARVHIAPAVASLLTGKASCYKGKEGNTGKCDITRSEDDTFFATVGPLGSYENMTIAVGFMPHAFTAYQPTQQERIFAILVTIWLVLLAIGSVAAVAVIVWMSIWRHKIMHRIKGQGTIIAEYLPPKDASVLLSSQVLSSASADMTAQLIDLAVRHYLKIYQTRDKTLFKPAEYELEIAKETADLRPEELQLLRDLFGRSNVRTGNRFAMKKLQNNYSLGQKLLTSRKQLQKDARGVYGLYERAEPEAKRFNRIGIIMLIIGIVTVSPLVVMAAIIAFIFAYTLWPLTEKGVALKGYLAGLREYITVAEKERLKMLQSPEGPKRLVWRYAETIQGNSLSYTNVYCHMPFCLTLKKSGQNNSALIMRPPQLNRIGIAVMRPLMLSSSARP